MVGVRSKFISGEKKMAYIASNPRSYKNKSVGDGQCVAFVRAASMAPATIAWRKGDRQVKTAKNIAAGTVIATFDESGRYGNRKDGNCHAAIFIRKTEFGVIVLDQWITNGKPQPVHERTIRFNNSSGKKINNGDEYYVVE